MYYKAVNGYVRRLDKMQWFLPRRNQNMTRRGNTTIQSDSANVWLENNNMKILLLNGVNMNMLGKRKTEFYGSDTLAELESKVTAYGKTLGVTVVCAQNNEEGRLVNILQQAHCDAVIFNAGAYSHYSYALRDCIECIDTPVVEVHMSDIYQRENFRHTDVLQDVCASRFYGNGITSYYEAVDYVVRELDNKK